jgi:hypothetical protein
MLPTGSRAVHPRTHQQYNGRLHLYLADADGLEDPPSDTAEDWIAGHFWCRFLVCTPAEADILMCLIH